MVELSVEQCEAASGGFIMSAIAISVFLTQGGYRAAVDFTSGAIEGFMEAGQ
jgi:hypothetical protein